jgi:hypothetical protein
MSKKAERRARTHDYITDPVKLDAIFAWIIDGYSLRDFCAANDIAYSTVQESFSKTPELQARYEAARAMQAETCMDEIAALEKLVESGKLDPRAGQVVIGSRQWRMERLNPKRYSPRTRQEVDIRHFDMAKLHALALRELAKRPRMVVKALETKEKAPALPAPGPVVIDAEVISGDAISVSVAAPAEPDALPASHRPELPSTSRDTR